MKIGVLSGKGGTGKTLVAVNLASVADQAIYVDCDVEEPNGHLFFKPEGLEGEEVTVNIPAVDRKACKGCKKCVEFCRFNALAYTNNRLIIFKDICHSCGGCLLFCPQGALYNEARPIGRIERGRSGNVDIFTGILNIGQPSSVPIIDELLNQSLIFKDLTLIDCPPGTACTTMESIKDADYCLLVAEDTLFGLDNLKMVYKLVKLFNKPHGLVLNRYLAGENLVEKFCSEKGIKILGRIPFDEELGKLNSNGLIASRESPKYKKIFADLLASIIGEVENNETIVNP